MGQAEKVSKLLIAAIISLSAILVAWLKGGSPDIVPIGDLLLELTTAGGAGYAVYWIMERIKGKYPTMSRDSKRWTALALSFVVPLSAYAGLVALALTELTERGAMLVVSTAFSLATMYYKSKEYSPGGKDGLETRPLNASEVTPDVDMELRLSEHVTLAGKEAGDADKTG